jgi:hypothetical protein
MRKQFPAKLLLLTALTFAGFVIVSQFFGVFGRSATDKTEAAKSDSVLQEIAKYRQWTLVNPTPVVMNPRAAIACARVTAGPFDPHETKWASVYVNAKGASAMMTEEHPRFPEGSIIVKEKLQDQHSEKPELLTAMIKHAPGYNPESRDWEYLVLDGPVSKIIEQGKLSSCNECHEKYVYTDFVTMRYLNWKPGVD